MELGIEVKARFHVHNQAVARSLWFDTNRVSRSSVLLFHEKHLAYLHEGLHTERSLGIACYLSLNAF